MQDDRISDMMRGSLEGIQKLADMNTLIGRAINTPSGTTVIPISKIALGFASGGVDIAGKKGADSKSYGGGGGTSVTVTPVAFLTIDKSGTVNLISADGEQSGKDKILSLIERAPEIIDRIKHALN